MILHFWFSFILNTEKPYVGRENENNWSVFDIVDKMLYEIHWYYTPHQQIDLNCKLNSDLKNFVKHIPVYEGGVMVGSFGVTTHSSCDGVATSGLVHTKGVGIDL